MADTGSLSTSQVITLGRHIELDLRGQDITDHAVQSALEGGARRGWPMYLAAAKASDAVFRRIVRAAIVTRKDRELEAQVLGLAADRAYTGTPYRKGTTVAIVTGYRTGTIARVSAVGRDGNYVLDTARGSVTAHHSELARTPHPWSWYQGVQDRHGPCDGCDLLQATMAAGTPR